LVHSGYYDGLTFHRVLTNFVIQGGDPLGDGTGGPNFRFDDEFHRFAIFNGNGQLAMANSGDDSNGSQFFVTLGPQRFLDFDYTIFGQLVRGFNVLTNINSVSTDTNDAPQTPVVITKAQIVSNTTDAVLILMASPNTNSTSATIKVIANDGKGSATNSFTAQSLADTVNDVPFLNPIPNITSPINTTAQIVLSGTDLEFNIPSFYAQLVSAPMGTGGSLTANIIRVIPPMGYVGPIRLLAAVQRSFFDFDTQTITIGVGDKTLTSHTSVISGFSGSTLSNVTVATFTDADTTSRPTNFTATINWGDNVVLTNTTVGTNVGGGFKVTGTHIYRFAGEYPVTVTVNDYLGATTTAFSTAFIAPAPALNISKLTNQFLLSWPIIPTNFSLQVSTDLSVTTNWLAVTNAPLLTNGEKRVTIDATNSIRFYRLQKP
ncbi:MAG TPA: peptidylprolyl isomerase, partial [Candidatus Eisenbacteria bacterium]|nr:peptidylprolyl isomerase [Candidatus Eisenbacteria bacterium]